MSAHERVYRPWPGVLAGHRAYLLPEISGVGLTLHEGGTPLVAAPRLGSRLGIDLHLKVEGQNPTGSFKDRGMVAAVAGAMAGGARTVVCASTGNTAASAAAYSARAGLKCLVILPAGAVSAGKVAQALVYGARLVPVRCGFDRALELARELAARTPAVLVNSLNPLRLEGQKTAAFEVASALGGAPDFLVLPVGNGGNIRAYWLGFQQYRRAGLIDRCPRIIGVQALGADPLVRGEPIAEPRTRATAICIGRPAGWNGAMDAIRESGGTVLAVDDSQIFAARDLLAADEGVFAEPASAAAAAGLACLAERGAVPCGSTVVLVLTGHGLKDPDAVLERACLPPVVEPEFPAILAAAGDGGAVDDPGI
ncbi:MAG: threonine synthase [Bacillota bacterium]|nr:threonine synthase [Bacillota bacterium]